MMSFRSLPYFMMSFRIILYLKLLTNLIKKMIDESSFVVISVCVFAMDIMLRLVQIWISYHPAPANQPPASKKRRNRFRQNPV